jgi:hypothetical protein
MVTAVAHVVAMRQLLFGRFGVWLHVGVLYAVLGVQSNKHKPAARAVERNSVQCNCNDSAGECSEGGVLLSFDFYYDCHTDLAAAVSLVTVAC